MHCDWCIEIRYLFQDLIDQENVQKLVVAAQQQTEDLIAKVITLNSLLSAHVSRLTHRFHMQEQIINNLRKQMNDIIEERDRLVESSM